ncbi:MAG: aminopeptidase P family protein [Bacteroidales bacterium]|nr:aminopeptidase P family protein [Bacteroidales bacterium]
MFTKEDYIQRRQALRQKMSGGLAFILGNRDSSMSYPANIYRFRQDSNFSYFFGINLPGFAGIIDLDNNKDYIFGNDFDIDDIIWMGPQPSVKDLAAEVGVEHTDTCVALQGFIKNAIKDGRKIHFLPAYREVRNLQIEKFLGISVFDTNEHFSLELVKAIISLREIKSEKEIAHLDAIQDIAYEMHTTAMKMAQDGVYEREIAGRIEGISLSHGGTVSFPIILSKRGETLHNNFHDNLLKSGDLMLTDAGYESPLNYTTDHTRVSPVGGKFTQKQREIYQIVLDANNNAFAATKPGVRYFDVHMVAARTIVEGLKNLGLMKGDAESAVEAGAHALFFPHGLGHMMGMDVHDMEDLGQIYVGYDETIQPSKQFGTAYLRLAKALKPGFVITNEPGIYFIPALIDQWQEQQMHAEFINYDKVNEYRDFGGIRLEDDILVTETGCRLLGKKRIPIEIDEVEALVQASK